MTAATATPVGEEQLRQQIEKEVRENLQAQFVKEIADFKQQLSAQNDAAMQTVLAEFREQQKPPSEEDIRTLLSQEYLTFDVEIPWDAPNSGGVTRTFTIRELPQAVEKRFYKTFKDQLLPRASDIGALAFEIAEGDVAKKLKSLLEAIDPAFDLMADAVVMILNPRGQEKELTREWVQENLSSYRQWNIINAQIMVNKLRDFFSQLSRGSKGMQTTLGRAGIRN